MQKRELICWRKNERLDTVKQVRKKGRIRTEGIQIIYAWSFAGTVVKIILANIKIVAHSEFGYIHIGYSKQYFIYKY